MPRQKKQHLKRRKDGRYKCVYHGIQFMGDTEAEALEKRDAYKRMEAAGAIQTADPTVEEYALKWLPLHKSDVSAKTYNDYAKQLEALITAIGEKKLRSVTVDDAASVWVHYSGYSASTIHRAQILFVGLFDAAVENDIIRKNPFRARYAKPPKAPSGTHRNLTEKEIALICSTPHRMQLAALVMLYAGLRRGEVLALSTNDIDYIAGTITVNKAVRFDSNKPILSTPKTAKGNRTVPVFSLLRQHLSIKRNVGILITAESGDYMTDTAFRRCWDSYLLHLSRVAGHQVSIRPHDLRHTYCTMLRDSGVDMHQAMIWMGHADEKMILRVYDHVTDSRTQNSIETVEKKLLKVQNEVQTENVPRETQ